MSKIKKKHVLIMGAGSSLRIYKEEIRRFIEKNNPVIFGCNYTSHIIIPDYLFWGDSLVSDAQNLNFKKSINEKSIVVLAADSKRKQKQLEQMERQYLTYQRVKRNWELHSDKLNSEEFKRCQVFYKDGIIYGCFRYVGLCAIFWAYIQGGSKISIVGMDGYTFYSEELLKQKKASQHCIGKGYTDLHAYIRCRKNDWDVYKTLRLLYKYTKKTWGFGFEIITPTIYEEFYNPNILKIKKDCNFQKWKEPTEEEYKKLYLVNCRIKDK